MVATDSFTQMFNVIDIFYLVTIPIILFMLLRTERRSRRRLDRIITELKQANEYLQQLHVDTSKKTTSS